MAMRNLLPVTWLLAALLALPASAAEQLDIRLIDAVEKQDTAAFRAMLDLGVDVNTPEVDGTRALHWAAHRDNLAMAETLIQAGAEVNARNRYGVAPLTLAAVNGNADMVRLLLEAGADANTESTQGEAVLLTAARTGVAEVLRLLLDHGADINARETWRGQSALMWAAAEGNLDATRLLVSRGAEIDATSDKGFSAMLFAARNGQTDVVQALHELGADFNKALPPREEVRTESGLSSAAQTGMTPLLLAVGSGHFETAALLLDLGADPNQAPLGWTPLHQVSWVRKAGTAGSNNPTPDGSGYMGSLHFVRELVAHGADLNARVSKRPPIGVSSMNTVGATPFLMAARTADVDLMRLLVDLGADPDLTNEDNSTALMIAAGIGSGAPGEDPGTEEDVLQAVTYALELGQDINAIDARGNTVMHGAAWKHLPRVVSFLHEQGATPEVWNRENYRGHTPLIIAQGVHRGMSTVRSRPTELALLEILGQSGP